MPSLPQRESLVSQTAAYLKAEVEGGRWRGWLPAERLLCAELQVSRNTLRMALTQLQATGVVRPRHGLGNQIVGRAKRRRDLRSRDVALLSPEPIERLRPTQTIWIDELRALLSERGCRLHVFHGRQYFRAHPDATLRKLIQQHPHGCWILALSNEAIQRWFGEHAPHCIVAGSVHAGLKLPFRDLDHRAMCRHAAGVFLALGHRRLALLIEKPRLAGDEESELGFVAGVGQSPHQDAEAIVCHHAGTVEGISTAMQRLMRRQAPPTALMVANAYHYLAVAGNLTRLGLRIPEDVSLISRDEDPFLTFLVPAPARYVVPPQMFARSLLPPVLEVLDGSGVTREAQRLMPEFIRGQTLAAAKSGM